MELRIYLIFSQWVLLFFQCNFNTAKALIGQNVGPAREGEYSFAACFTQRIPLNELTVHKIYCSGAAITKNHVLLTAHCIENKKKHLTQLIVGSANILNGKIYYPFWWITFEQWSIYRKKRIEYKTNDIAVIKTTEAFSSEINPIPLSHLSNADLFGKEVETIGWGVSNNGLATMNLQKAKLLVLSHSECESMIKRAQGVKVKVQKTNLCTFKKPFALLNVGDSGGPVIFKNTIVGMNKATIPNSVINQDKINTHVGLEVYRQFIFFVTNNIFVWF